MYVEALPEMPDIFSYRLNIFTDVGQPLCDCATNEKGNPLMLISY